MLNTKEEIKKALEESGIDLRNSSTDAIMSVIERVCETKSKEKIKEMLDKRSLIDRVKKCSYKNCHKKSLSRSAVWKKQQNEIKVKGEKTVEATITSLPTSELKVFTHLKDGKKGINSNKRDTKHAMNLWKTDVQTKEGKSLFSGIRHGNTRGKESSTKEIILAAAVQQHSVEKLLDDKNNKIWEVNLANMQLMTPAGKFNPVSVDNNMPFKQMEGFNKLIDKPFEMEVPIEKGGTKKVKLVLKSPILVNFGVNLQHYKLGIFTKSSKEQNKKAFEDLFGEGILKTREALKKHLPFKINLKIQKLKNSRLKESELKGKVGEFIKKLGQSDSDKLKKKEIINLSQQLLDIWVITDGKGYKSNPAAIQTRFATLMYLLGYSVSFNCKSGKDRTGQVSAEINDLVLSMEANNGEVPYPSNEMTAHERMQLSEVYDATQSDTIAQANTGYKGLKIPFKKALERLGEVRGDSKNAKI